MRTEIHHLATLMLLGASLGGCAVCTCEEPSSTELTIDTGSYAAEGPSLAAANFPHGDEKKTMEVDRATSMVEIRYVADGQQVVERWRMTDQ